jgi:hypothetical protein
MTDAWARPARRAVAALAFAAAALFPSMHSAASSASPRDALPRPGERLPAPVRLPHCAMPIVEWRPTAALPDETTMSERALAVVDESCRRAFDRYADFLRARGLPHAAPRTDELPSLSLLPANVALDGREPRALNDVNARFEAVAPGCCYWGLYVESIHHLFLRNDPLTRDAAGVLGPNPRFIRTITHEIGHVLSDAYGVWASVPYDRQHDEDLAEDFVAFLGMTFPVESSAEDLAAHRSGAVAARP